MTAPIPVPAQVLAAIGDRLDGRPLAIMLDVDGTLAPIAPRPEDARVPDETRRVLESLVATRGVTVAVVSGRAAADSSKLVGVTGIWVIGNHGMEVQSPYGACTPHPDAVAYGDDVAAAARELHAAAAALPGVFVENKRWTLSLHYRLARDADVAGLVAHARTVAAEHGLRVTEGKKVIELRPPISVNKGTATVALAEKLGVLARTASLMFAGDDRTDEDAFRQLRERSGRAVTVRVGLEAADSAAEFLLRGTDELRALLEAIALRANRA